MHNLKNLKRSLFPKGIRRCLSRHTNRIFLRTTEPKLSECFRKLEILEGSVICIHSMLSGLGYIVGGPESLIRGVQSAVHEATIMMPTFPFDGSMDDYLSTIPVYHKDKTPSRSGLLSEALRLMPGAKRSYHPTHPCAAIGPKAELLIEGSEKSETPFGDDSTYGRFSELDEAILLLVHTNNTSIVHRFQEIVQMPNLFRKEYSHVKGYDIDNRIAKYKVKVHIPQIPLYVIMPGDRKGDVNYIWFPDYALLFPNYNRKRILNKINGNVARDILIARHQYFIDRGIYRIAKMHEAEIMAVTVKPWLERICMDVRESLVAFSKDYSFENMRRASQGGLLSK